MPQARGARTMQEVARFSDVYQAEVAAAFLVAHGVEAVVPERLVATVNPVLQTALGGVRVLAPRNQAGEAMDLLARARKGEFAGDPEAEAPEVIGAAGTDGLFPIVTAAAGLLMGDGYAGRAFLGDRAALSGVQRVGIVLLATLVLGWGLLWAFGILASG